MFNWNRLDSRWRFWSTRQFGMTTASSVAAHQSSDNERALDAASHGFKAPRELDVNRR
jgi:hypothetical protein